jgi:hypothetical protein
LIYPRFTRHFGEPDAEKLVIGFDVVIVENERIRTIHGFIDRAPATAVPKELIRKGAILVGALRAS